MSGLLGEGLLAPSGVRLFGRDYTGLTIADLGLNPTSNDPLVTQLSNAKPVDGRPPYGLARIYGFSYLGNYFKLASPIVMLVWGPGIAVPGGNPRVTLSILGVTSGPRPSPAASRWGVRSGRHQRADRRQRHNQQPRAG
jgi:hypothetical protein